MKGASRPDILRLEQADNDLGHGSVVRMAGAADGRFDAALGRPE